MTEVSSAAVVFEATHPIRFGDIDMFGHVNYLAVLSYCESTRASMFLALGRDLGVDVMDGGFVVGDLSVRYLRPIYLAQESVHVRAGVIRLGTASARLSYELTVEGEAVAAVETGVVFMHERRSRPMTDAERAWLTRYVTSAPV